LYYDYVAFPKHVTRLTPLQLFGQGAAKNDRSQFLKFVLPFSGFPKKEISLGICLVHD
jgi:hypothetical protein